MLKLVLQVKGNLASASLWALASWTCLWCWPSNQFGLLHSSGCLINDHSTKCNSMGKKRWTRPSSNPDPLNLYIVMQFTNWVIYNYLALTNQSDRHKIMCKWYSYNVLICTVPNLRVWRIKISLKCTAIKVDTR